MKLYLRKPSISIKCLAMTLLLSFIGQVLALPDVCTMSNTTMSNTTMSNTTMSNTRVTDSSLSATDFETSLDTLEHSSSPCHDMNLAQDSALASATHLVMDCCDSSTLADSSCACPDGSCSGSVPLFNQGMFSSLNFSEQRNYYSQSGFPNPISSALFRPPIA
jgi:hypothetical protein